MPRKMNKNRMMMNQLPSLPKPFLLFIMVASTLGSIPRYCSNGAISPTKPLTVPLPSLPKTYVFVSLIIFAF